MRVAIYQPRYFPQLHYFNRIITSDIFVFLDSAQYTKALTQMTAEGIKRVKSYQSDTPIKSPLGATLLTVPVKHSGLTPLNQIGIDYNQKWTLKHLARIKNYYFHSQFFDTVFPEIKKILSFQYINLAHLNMMTIIWSLFYLFDNSLPVEKCTLNNINDFLSQNRNIKLSRITSSDIIGIKRPDGLHRGTEWTTAICKKLKTTEYLHGETAKSGYMDLNYYREHGIKTIVQNWTCHPYDQQFNSNIGFLPNLSIIDLLFNVPIYKARQIIGLSQDKKKSFNQMTTAFFH